MEWSLVLMSQGIESTIVRSPEYRCYFLVVAEEQYKEAERIIRIYQIENRGWGWRRKIAESRIEFHWGSLVWCVMLAVVFAAQAFLGEQFTKSGLMDNELFVSGEWWRAFTAVTLHADLGHLGANLTIGLVFWGLAMGRYGPGTALLSAFLAGVFGNLAGVIVYGTPHLSLGASGMVMGGLGIVAVQIVPSAWRSPLAARIIVPSISGGVLLMVLLGFSPESDVIAHVGGFIGGLVLGVVIGFFPDAWIKNDKVNLLCVCVLIACVAVPWAIAF